MHQPQGIRKQIMYWTSLILISYPGSKLLIVIGLPKALEWWTCSSSFLTVNKCVAGWSRAPGAVSLVEVNLLTDQIQSCLLTKSSIWTVKAKSQVLINPDNISLVLSWQTAKWPPHILPDLSKGLVFKILIPKVGAGETVELLNGFWHGPKRTGEPEDLGMEDCEHISQLNRMDSRKKQEPIAFLFVKYWGDRFQYSL